MSVHRLTMAGGFLLLAALAACGTVPPAGSLNSGLNLSSQAETAESGRGLVFRENIRARRGEDGGSNVN